MNPLYTNYMENCTAIIGNLPMTYTVSAYNKINYIYICDYIDFEFFDQLLNSITQYTDRHFIIITEHWLPIDFYNNYKNIHGINYIYNKFQLFNELNKDPLGITYMKNESVTLQPDLFTLCDCINPEQNHKEFSILLGNKNPIDRHQIYSFLKYFKILDECNYSINKNKDFYQLYETCANLFENRLNESYSSIQETITHDGNPTTAREYRFDHKKNIKSIANLVKKSTVYISLENQPLDKIGGYVCEKSLYGFMFKKPTVHIGLPYNIHVLERLGFKSFSPVISQEFNKIKNNNEKIISFCKELLFIQTLSQSFLNDWHIQIKPIIAHNRNVVELMPEASLAEWKKLVVKLVNIEKQLLQHSN